MQRRTIGCMNGQQLIRHFDLEEQILAAETVRRIFNYRQMLALPPLVLLISLLSQCVIVRGFSMEPTLVQGDWLLLNRLATVAQNQPGPRLFLGHRIERGDLIVFQDVSGKREFRIKRVIGLPGDRVRIANGQVYVNGEKLIEPYVEHGLIAQADYRENFPQQPDGPVSIEALSMLKNDVRNHQIVVPPGDLFVLGDNRENSIDSRYLGFVLTHNVVGTPILVLWSYDPNVCFSTVGDHGGCVWKSIRWWRVFYSIR